MEFWRKQSLAFALIALHNSEIICQYLIGRTEIPAGLWDIVRTSIVSFKLPSTVLKAIHAHFLVEPSLINAVLAFHLAGVSWRSNTDSVIDNTVLIKHIFKQAVVITFLLKQSIRELCAIICLNFSYGKRTFLHQVSKEPSRAVCAVFVIHFAVRPTSTLIYPQYIDSISDHW